MYDLDGNTEYFKDSYDKKLTALHADSCIRALEKDAKKWDGEFSKWLPSTVLAALKSIVEHCHSEEICVVLYGH